MKSEDGVATEEQKEFLRGVSGEGYCAVIAQGVDEARSTIQWYIGITDHEPPSVLKTRLICQAVISDRQKEQHSNKKKRLLMIVPENNKSIEKRCGWQRRHADIEFKRLLPRQPAQALPDLREARLVRIRPRRDPFRVYARERRGAQNQPPRRRD